MYEVNILSRKPHTLARLDAGPYLEHGVIPHGPTGLASVVQLVLVGELVISRILPGHHSPAELLVPCIAPPHPLTNTSGGWVWLFFFGTISQHMMWHVLSMQVHAWHLHTVFASMQMRVGLSRFIVG